MLNNNLTWLLSKYIHRKDWLSFLKLNTTFYDFGSLLSSGITPYIYTNFEINRITLNDKILVYLLSDPRTNQSTWGFDLIYFSAFYGDEKTITLLLQDPQIEISNYGNNAMINAAENGHYKIVALLLHNLRVNQYYDSAIINAAYNGHVKVMSLLLQYSQVNPAIYNNDAICTAAFNGHEKIIAILLKDPRVNPNECNCILSNAVQL